MARTVELLWGVSTPRGTRGPRQGLSVAAVTRAALAIADAEGLGAVSMQRVAKELGYTTMSLYNYVPSKDQLIELMIDAATPPPPIPEDGESWRDEVERWVRATWGLYHAHRWVLKVPTVNPPLGPNQMAWFEALLHALHRGGLEGAELMAIAQHILTSTRGQAAISIDLATGEDGTAAEANEALRRLATPDRFPTLHGLIPAAGAGGFHPGAEIYEGLALGVRLLLDGMEGYVRRGAG
ncbi:TetR/AcrR family transcriptional regulator [Allorhizocola rhizosphaerae]|uniref:TetR/AcrR family transcriptional regulator n=1 Tax=Allorhizocola rhizosphaerae TaxID=1872709 RepID=UPI001B8D1E80|nr:TetR/AcrR family transcriptional regulator [Allorhizocola rhizosphaerae]